MSPDRLTFAHPDWLWSLLVIPALLAAKIWADRRSSRSVDAFVAPRLRDLLVSGLGRGRSWLIFPLQLAALLCFIIALCRPQWGEEKREIREQGRDVIIAIDTSKSMLADDVKPDRLARAKLAAQDLLALIPQDRVGLIAFAGQAYLQAPLTNDHDAVLESIQALDHTSIPSGGSDLTKAIRLAIETVEKSPAQNHGLILFSDGGDPEAGLDYYAGQARRKKVIVVTVGVGTEAGALIPDPEQSRAGDFIRDSQGNVVQSKLESGVLQQLSQATGGRYLKLTAQPLTGAIVREILASLDQQQDAAREERKPIERFAWPLSCGILLLMLAWLIRSAPRRLPAPAAAMVVFFLALPSEGRAASLGSLFGAIFDSTKPDPAEAQASYAAGNFEKARDGYARLLADEPGPRTAGELHYGLAASSLQLQDYDRAAGAFSEALQSKDRDIQNRSHRGMAHTLYDQGDRQLAKLPEFTIKAWTDSLRHFDASLAIRESEEVRENREFVKKRLDELKKKMGKEDGQKQKGDKGKGDDGEEGEEGDKPGEKDGKGQKGKSGKPGGDEQKPGGEEGEKKDGQSGEEKDGKQGQEGQDQPGGQGGESVPEGQLQAGKPGERADEEEARLKALAESEKNEATGFSRNEARALLRTYADDQKSVRMSLRRSEAHRGKDW